MRFPFLRRVAQIPVRADWESNQGACEECEGGGGGGGKCEVVEMGQRKGDRAKGKKVARAR